MAREHRSSRSYWPKQYEQFRRRLIEARDEAGLTQREAATLLNRSQSYVAKSESGERRVDVVEAAQFARIYHKPVAFFLGASRTTD